MKGIWWSPDIFKTREEIEAERQREIAVDSILTKALIASKDEEIRYDYIRVLLCGAIAESEIGSIDLTKLSTWIAGVIELYLMSAPKEKRVERLKELKDYFAMAKEVIDDVIRTVEEQNRRADSSRSGEEISGGVFEDFEGGDSRTDEERRAEADSDREGNGGDQAEGDREDVAGGEGDDGGAEGETEKRGQDHEG